MNEGLIPSLIAVSQAIERSSISDKSSALDKYTKDSASKSNQEARKVARALLGEDILWNWDRE